MIRVLQIADNMDIGGIQAFIMNVYRNIDKTKIQFDFLVFRDYEQYYEREILSYGGIIYKLPGRKQGFLKHKKYIVDFYKKHPQYKIIHYHTSSLSDVTVLSVARKIGIPIRIIHSHSTKAPGGGLHTYFHKFNKCRIEKIATDFLACGNLAAKWFYDGTSALQNVCIITNGIDCKSYNYDDLKRKRKREELEISKNFVIGQIGRIAEVKNHHFTLQVLKRVCELYSDKRPILLIAGDGPLRPKIENYAEEIGIRDNVLFLGNRDDVKELLMAMDVMIMPSLYEGFPVTAVEAQASGLPCVLSDTITKDAVLKKNCIMLSLNEDLENWCEAIINNTDRVEDNSVLYNAGFDIESTIDALMKLYCKG